MTLCSCGRLWSYNLHGLLVFLVPFLRDTGHKLWYPLLRPPVLPNTQE